MEYNSVVYIYDYNPLSKHFEKVAKLISSDFSNLDSFGYSVAISGDTVVVGAPLADNIGHADSGSVYIYKKPINGWVDSNQENEKVYSTTPHDNFGISVSIMNNTIAVGVSGGDSIVNDSGYAYVFERNTTTNPFKRIAKLSASDGAVNDYFGSSISISADTIIVGASGDDDSGYNSGSAYLYEKSNNGWVNSTQSAKLTASDGASDNKFGNSVDISGDTVVIGTFDFDHDAGSAYIYEKSIYGWRDSNQTIKLTTSDDTEGDAFGYLVAISNDIIVVGAYGSGSAYLYERSNNGWLNSTESASLTTSDGEIDDNFGNSVAISGDTIVVGVESNNDSSGSVYIFKAKTTTINPAVIMYLLN